MRVEMNDSTEELIRMHNPKFKKGDTVIAQDLVDDELNRPLDEYNTGVYRIKCTRPGVENLDIILEREGEEIVVPLHEFMEHGIVGGARLTVVRFTHPDPEKAKRGRELLAMLMENKNSDPWARVKND